MTLKMTNTVSKKEYEFNVTDMNDSKMYYHFKNLTLESGMDDGSYEYNLLDNDNNLVAQGVLQIGDYVPQKTVYNENGNNNPYKIYNG